ncbi:hypothetical protein [Alkalimarinus coralli]|uniref:hypothetical protein n=1 Tax=Alkalimarinus coralli TaxID=2935863 RepID=UPI00202B0AF1|nr:hypothetical protein [Alkalimarinus coralli]
MVSNSKIKIVVGALVFLCGIIYLIGNLFIVDFYPTSSGISKSYSEDTDIVEFFIYSPKAGRTDLCVPEAYFLYSKDIRRGVKSDITLLLHYPSLKPWNIYAEEFVKKNPDYKNWSRKKQREWLVEKSLLTLRPLHGEDFIHQFWDSDFFGKDKLKRQSEFSVFEKYESGLWQYTGDSKALPQSDDYFVSPNPENYSSVFKCNTSHRCTLETFYSESMTFEFNFSRNHLKKFKRLNDDIQSLIETFVCKKDSE